jgi:subtilisin family serine protease
VLGLLRRSPPCKNASPRAGWWPANFGACVDIFAPGVTILGAFTGGDTATANLSGTSMASARVAGVVAGYLQHHPLATPASQTATATCVHGGAARVTLGHCARR